MEQGMGPEVRKFFRKILNTLSYGLIWLIAVVTAGIYYKLGWRADDKPVIYVILFYIAAVVSLFFLLRYFYKLWKE